VRFGQSREEGVNTITQTNIVLCIKHVEHLVGVLYSGVVTRMHDFRKSGRSNKIGSEGRMCIPNRPVVNIPEVGPAFPFVSLVLFAGCSLDGWCIGKEGVKRISTEPPCRLTNWCGLGVHLLWDV